MDPRKFLAPIQCTLCDLLLYTLRDVSQHCSCHDQINFICHHCLRHFDSKGAIAAHMNQKGAHLRQSFDMSTNTSAMPSPAPCITAVLPLSQPAPHPTPTLSGLSPTTTVAISDNVSLDLRDIDAPNTGHICLLRRRTSTVSTTSCLDAAAFSCVARRVSYCWGTP